MAIKNTANSNIFILHSVTPLSLHYSISFLQTLGMQNSKNNTITPSTVCNTTIPPVCAAIPASDLPSTCTASNKYQFK
ncbi:unnamed protein product [Amaranthus hypochondriacus]